MAATTSRLPLPRGTYRPTLQSAAGIRLELDDFLPYDEVSPGYLGTAGIPILEGRSLRPEDTGSSGAVVNELLARRLWPDRPAVGSTFRVREDGPWLTVVGVAADAPQFGLRDHIGEGLEYYIPIPRDRVSPERTFLVRTRGDPAAAAEAVRRDGSAGGQPVAHVEASHRTIQRRQVRR